MAAKDQGAEATGGRWLTLPRTLCFVFHGVDVLLMKRGPHKRVFPNRYNGLGGHIERDEDPASGALREIEEESGLAVHSLRLCSIHNIDAGGQTGILLFVYTAISDSRDFIDASAEGKLEWVPLDTVWQLDLVEDLPQLLPRILALAADAPPLQSHVSYDAQDMIRLRFWEAK